MRAIGGVCLEETAISFLRSYDARDLLKTKDATIPRISLQESTRMGRWPKVELRREHASLSRETTVEYDEKVDLRRYLDLITQKLDVPVGPPVSLLSYRRMDPTSSAIAGITVPAENAIFPMEFDSVDELLVQYRGLSVPHVLMSLAENGVTVEGVSVRHLSLVECAERHGISASRLYPDSCGLRRVVVDHNEYPCLHVAASELGVTAESLARSVGCNGFWGRREVGGVVASLAPTSIEAKLATLLFRFREYERTIPEELAERMSDTWQVPLSMVRMHIKVNSFLGVIRDVHGQWTHGYYDKKRRAFTFNGEPVSSFFVATDEEVCCGERLYGNTGLPVPCMYNLVFSRSNKFVCEDDKCTLLRDGGGIENEKSVEEDFIVVNEEELVRAEEVLYGLGVVAWNATEQARVRRETLFWNAEFSTLETCLENSMLSECQAYRQETKSKPPRAAPKEEPFPSGLAYHSHQRVSDTLEILWSGDDETINRHLGKRVTVLFVGWVLGLHSLDYFLHEPQELVALFNAWGSQLWDKDLRNFKETTVSTKTEQLSSLPLCREAFAERNEVAQHILDVAGDLAASVFLKEKIVLPPLTTATITGEARNMIERACSDPTAYKTRKDLIDKLVVADSKDEISPLREKIPVGKGKEIAARAFAGVMSFRSLFALKK